MPPPAAAALPEPDAIEPVLAPLRELLQGKKLLAITGAGISTDSGIPDYRSPGSTPRTPITIQQFVASESWRRHWWARNQVGWGTQLAVSPNAGHDALAYMERQGLLVGVITQNIDRLHARAGTETLIELHGRYDIIRCANCATEFTREEVGVWLDEANPGWVSRHINDVEIAPDADAVLTETGDFRLVDCPVCGGMLRPDVVFFGDSVPQHKVAAAFELTDSADAVVVAGSSLAVASALRFVRHAHRAGKPIVIINRGATRADELATGLAHVSTTRALPWLAAELQR